MSKNNRVTIRITDDDMEKLKEIEDHINDKSPFTNKKPFNLSAVLRSAIRFAHAVLVR